MHWISCPLLCLTLTPKHKSAQNVPAARTQPLWVSGEELFSWRTQGYLRNGSLYDLTIRFRSHWSGLNKNITEMIVVGDYRLVWGICSQALFLYNVFLWLSFPMPFTKGYKHICIFVCCIYSVRCTYITFNLNHQSDLTDWLIEAALCFSPLAVCPSWCPVVARITRDIPAQSHGKKTRMERVHTHMLLWKLNFSHALSV